jgi:selenocysteine lyase/cysteine desulfurase
LEQSLECYRLGGTGTQSDDDLQPESMPDRYEAGNHNAPGLAGLEAALSFLQTKTIESLERSESELTERLVIGFRATPGVTVYGHGNGVPHVGVVSININGLASQEAASILDDSFQVQTRAGLHCAPGVHRFLGTIHKGGTIRFSVGPFTTTVHIDQALAAVKELAYHSP